MLSKVNLLALYEYIMYHTDNQLDILSIRAALDFQFWSAYLACISLTLVSTKQTKDMQRFQIEKSKSFIMVWNWFISFQ